MPRLPSWGTALGPGVVWLALAQGSSELVEWPTLVAKYGLTFLWLLAPACLLQYPLSIEVGRYTLLTGEGILPGLYRVHPLLGGVTWLLAAVASLWLASFASAGGTALASLTQFPGGFTAPGRTLFWAYLSVVVFVLALASSRAAYRLIERCAKAATSVTIFGLLWACSQPEVRAVLPTFVRAFGGPPGPSDRGWDVNDSARLLTAVTLVGLGGFWVLLYSYWVRGKGSGMAAHRGDDAGGIAGHLMDDSPASAAQWPHWRRWLTVDVGLGVVGNLVTTAGTCLLAYALLYSRGILPEAYEIAIVQRAFSETGWGSFGRILFLGVAAAFLADAWVVTADGLSRMHADLLYHRFPRARRLGLRRLYWVALAALTTITCLTLPFDPPGAFVRASAAAGFAGTVVLPPALWILNHRRLAPVVPPWARPRRIDALLLLASFTTYALLVTAYVWASWPLWDS